MRSAEYWAEQVAYRGCGWELEGAKITTLMAEVQSEAFRAGLEAAAKFLESKGYELWAADIRQIKQGGQS